MRYLIFYCVFAAWVLYDSALRRVGRATISWVLGTAILGPIVLPIYLAKRPLLDGEGREGGTPWNILRNFVLMWTIVLGMLVAYALYQVSRETSRLVGWERTGAELGSAIGFGLLGVLWFLPTLCAALLGFFLKKTAVTERGPSASLLASGPRSVLRIPDWAGLGSASLVGFAIFTLSDRTWHRQDGVTSSALGPPAVNDSHHSAWYLRQATAPDGSPRIVLVLDADNPVATSLRVTVTPALSVACSRGQEDVIVIIVTPPAPEPGLEQDAATVALTVDRGETQVQTWHHYSSESRSMLVSPDPRSLIQHLAQADVLQFGFTPSGSTTRVARFAVRRFDQYLNQIISTCPMTLK